MLTAGGAGVALPLIAAGGASAAAQPAATAGDISASPHHQVAEQFSRQAAAGSYTVLSGDTLSKIADAEGVDGGWRQLYDANRDVIGGDPNLIQPGQELSLAGGTGSSSSAPSTDEQAPAPAEEPAEDTSTESGTGYTSPVAGGVGTGYGVAGSMWSSGYHTGVDFSIAEGTSVVAVTSGEVVSAGDGGAYGNEVVILHPDGHYSQYAHLSSISVSVGQQVGTGEQVGLSGATGNVTGPHLHFEVRTGPDYGSDVDPVAYLLAHGVDI